MPYRKHKYFGIQKPPVGSVINWGHPMSYGLKSAWLFNEQGGHKYIDIAGNVGVVSVSGTIVGNTGRYGSCIDCGSGGGNGFLTTMAAGSIPANQGSAWTLLAIVFTTNAVNGPSGTVINFGEITDNNYNFLMGMDITTNNVASHASGGSGFGAESGVVLAANVWNRIGYSQTNHISRVFLSNNTLSANTTDVGTNALSTTGALQCSIGRMYVNQSPKGAAEDLNGRLACVFSWNRALTQTELLSWSNNPWQFISSPKRRISGAAPKANLPNFGLGGSVGGKILSTPTGAVSKFPLY